MFCRKGVGLWRDQLGVVVVARSACFFEVCFHVGDALYFASFLLHFDRVLQIATREQVASTIEHGWMGSTLYVVFMN
jgi:hypothetical protein